MPNNQNAPVEIRHRQQSRLLCLTFEDGASYTLPCEYLRVFSPSAEVMGHNGKRQLVAGKREVNITGIEPAGAYALRLYFDDGHNTGLFTWEYLRELGDRFEQNWADYIEDLNAQGQSR